MWLVSALVLLAAPAAPQFEEIVAAVTAANHDESCAAMAAWVDAHPKDPRAAQGLLWMARLRISDRRPEDARPLLERALRDSPPGDWPLHAKKGLADLDLEAHRFDRAIAAFDALAREPAPLWRYVGSSAAANARGERTRFYAMFALVLALALLWLSRVARAGVRMLWPPPTELVYVLPILLVMLAAATAQEEPEAHALVTLGLSAIALLWLNGAWLRARPPGPRSRYGQALLGLLQVASLLYCAMVGNGLWGKLMDTVAMGAE